MTTRDLLCALLLKSWAEIGKTRLISWLRLMNEAPSCYNVVIDGDLIRPN